MLILSIGLFINHLIQVSLYKIFLMKLLGDKTTT